MSTQRGRDPERTPLVGSSLRPLKNAPGMPLGPTPEALRQCNVFSTTLLIRQDLIDSIDTPIAIEKTQDPEIVYGIIEPLTKKYTETPNLSIVHCLLANRLKFLDDAAQLPHARLHETRAAIAEVLAIRCLNHFAVPPQSPPLAVHSLSPNRARVTRETSLPAVNGGRARARRSSAAEYRAVAVEGARQRRQSHAGGFQRPSSVGRVSSRTRTRAPVDPGTTQARIQELTLANVLVAPFHPFAGAPPEVLAEEEMEGRKGMGKPVNALELAIVSEAKLFISSASCQKVVSSIYYGRISYTPVSFFDIVPDVKYKRKPISLYDVRTAPLLDHYRLRVPRYRILLDMSQFLIVFALTMIVLWHKDATTLDMSPWEFWYIVYMLGWSLDRFATTLEHGWRIFAANLWNGIDACIIGVFFLYLPLRLYGGAIGDSSWSQLALSILSIESSLLFPRLAFLVLSRSVLVMSLRRMLIEFAVLMFTAVWIFLGFWHALYTIDEGNSGVWDIAKYMVNIWFGLDATGFELSVDFHPFIGPALFFVFACLANTLFITVVVSILSTTFAELNVDAKAEFMFRAAVGILEGVKSDALFSFQPPINILALIILLPASWVLSPRAFHRTHVFFTRLANAPLLIVIRLYEKFRRYYRLSPTLFERIQRTLPGSLQELSIFMSGAHGDLEAVWDYAPDAKLLADADRQDAEWSESTHHPHGLHPDLIIDNEAVSVTSTSPRSASIASRRRLSPHTDSHLDGILARTGSPARYPGQHAHFNRDSASDTASLIHRSRSQHEIAAGESALRVIYGRRDPIAEEAPPLWAIELQEQLKSIASRQFALEAALSRSINLSTGPANQPNLPRQVE